MATEETTETQSTETPVVESTQADTGADPVQDAPTAPEVPTYTPNYKLRVMDQDKEIPEHFRSLMKDEASEKEVREIFEKAYGLEFAKPKHEATQQTLSQIQKEHSGILENIQQARDLYQRGDMESFFQKLAIPEQRVLQWAINKLQYHELPPDQKAAIDARTNAERTAWQAQQQLQQTQGVYQEQIRQARQSALNSELARPEIKSMVDSFDQRMGKPGAFVKEVVNRGQLAWYQSNGKIDLTPGQAIEEVIGLYGLRGAAPASAGLVQPASQQAPAQQPKTATIPNVGSGKSASPLKQKPRNIEDLKKMREAMIANEG